MVMNSNSEFDINYNLTPKNLSPKLFSKESKFLSFVCKLLNGRLEGN